METRALGDITIARAIEMTIAFEATTFFPDTSVEDWTPHIAELSPHHYVPDTGMLLFPVQSYVVRTPHYNILIDTCIGNDKDRSHRPDWHMRTDDSYMKALTMQGLYPQDIDYVMCTHLHADHIGWNTKMIDGRWVPTFPNAKYVISRRDFEEANAPDQPEHRKAQLRDSLLPIVEAGQAELVGHDFAIGDEIALQPTPGHTPDHLAISLESKGQNAVMSGDLMHSPIQCKYPEWRAWPDWDPDMARVTRHAFLEQFCETDVLICTAHFPLPSAGRVIRSGDAFRFVYDEGQW
jgi:glyoxylase-like metal-dependent hydrolase (beta-lactamase superfamily II)